MNKDIMIPYEDILGTSYVAFKTENFNYFDYSSMNCEYNEKTREFTKDGYRFSLPSVGVENSLVKYITNNIKEDMDKNYDFIFLLGNKNKLTKKEIKNLIMIFNEDLEEKEKENINKIVKLIYPSIGYSLKIDNKIINLDLKINFETLFI